MGERSQQIVNSPSLSSASNKDRIGLGIPAVLDAEASVEVPAACWQKTCGLLANHRLFVRVPQDKHPMGVGGAERPISQLVQKHFQLSWMKRAKHKEPLGRELRERELRRRSLGPLQPASVPNSGGIKTQPHEGLCIVFGRGGPGRDESKDVEP